MEMVKEFNTISMIGLGYIGLPTAAMFASRKIRVIGVDVNQSAVDTINKGQIHIVEPELDMIVGAAVSQGFLRATTKPEPADAFLIAVPTPFMGDHEPDLSFVESAAKSIAPVIKKGDLVILESTSPVGATEQMADWLANARPDLSFPQQVGDSADINIAYCPERVLPGRVVQELVNNDRIIGGITPKCSLRAISLYKTFVEGQCIEANVRTAEMCKLTENSYRDVNIAFANELSMICDELDIDVWELIRLANRHPRVNILQPGPGVGGHCIAVDPWFVVSRSPKLAKLICSAREVNDAKPEWVFNKIRSAIGNFLLENSGRTAESVTIACLGLTFKADIDDLRESPAIDIVERLVGLHLGLLMCVEPNISELPDSLKGKVSLDSLTNAIKLADIVVILVDHKSFKEFPWINLTKKSIIDTRGVCSK
jgi:UDP-N-acetyl-D-mannosaminuronic acid dehydrogenase